MISFPLLVLLIATFFLLMTAAVTRMQTAIQSRNLAFQQRYADGSQRTTGADQIDVSSAAAMKRIFGGGHRLPGGESMITATETRRANPILRIFERVLPEASVTNYVLFDPWDHRTLPFEEHAPLAMGQRCAAFGIAPGKLARFQALASVSGSAHDGSTSREERRAREAAKATEEEIRAAERELDDLRRATPPDWDKIRDTEDKIRKLKEAQQLLNEAM